MRANFITIGAILMAVTVILGAFGAHFLKSKIGTYELGIFEKGVNYQGIHSIALILTGIIKTQKPNLELKWVGYFLILGMMFFCGSLYLLALKELAISVSIVKVLGPITPLGGLSFIFAWLILAYKLFQKEKK